MILKILYTIYFGVASGIMILSVSDLFFGAKPLLKKLKKLPARTICVFVWPLMLISPNGRKNLLQNLDDLV